MSPIATTAQSSSSDMRTLSMETQDATDKLHITSTDNAMPQPPSKSSPSVTEKAACTTSGSQEHMISGMETPPQAAITDGVGIQIERSNQGSSEDAFVVKWEDGDPENPQNWSTARKSWLTFLLGQLALASSLGSAITSPASDAIAAELGMSREATVLGVSLYVLGFAVGPLVWAPMSEVWGRRIGTLPATSVLALFSIGAGASQTAQAFLVCRFLSGIFGSAPVSNVSAALGDIWSPRVRGTAVAIYAVAVVGGPTIGPVIGAALTVNPHLGWRWTCYVLAAWVAAVTVVVMLAYPETYAPCLLKRRAQALRKRTGDARWHHPHEHISLDPASIVTKHLARPALMLTTEPMVACLALYAAFVYALQFVALEVFPVVYGERRGWSPLIASLPFLAQFVGEFGALVANLANQPRVARAMRAAAGRSVPEARLPPMLLGGALFTAGLFWFGWTADPQFPWESSVAASVLVGAGFDIIFQQCVNYLVDTYVAYAASAVSATTLLRSLLAAALPFAARPMLDRLGVGPAMSILGGIAALALPVPLVLMRYGLKLRRMSKFAPVDE